MPEPHRRRRQRRPRSRASAGPASSACTRSALAPTTGATCADLARQPGRSARWLSGSAAMRLRSRALMRVFVSLHATIDGTPDDQGSGSVLNNVVGNPAALGQARYCNRSRDHYGRASARRPRAAASTCPELGENSPETRQKVGENRSQPSERRTRIMRARDEAPANAHDLPSGVARPTDSNL
jgi:hypothetical protein